MMRFIKQVNSTEGRGNLKKTPNPHSSYIYVSDFEFISCRVGLKNMLNSRGVPPSTKKLRSSTDVPACNNSIGKIDLVLAK